MTKLRFVLTNILGMLSFYIFANIPNFTPDKLSGLEGSFAGFVYIYFVPIVMHLLCYYGMKPWAKHV